MAWLPYVGRSMGLSRVLSYIGAWTLGGVDFAVSADVA
jgi:hypothetical protein